MKVYSFPQGGISFRDPGAPPRDSSVNAFLPGLSVIPLIQHTGPKAEPVVQPGDTVTEGMLLGVGHEVGSANIHASVPGRVIKIVSWEASDGRTNEALVIRMEGAFSRLGKQEETYPWDGLSPYETQQIIAEHGIVEMEGDGRPLADLLTRLRAVREPIILAVRCVFDDPWTAADYTVCRERAGAVAEGAVIMAKAAGAGRIIYAVSKEEKDLGDTMTKAAATWGQIPASAVFTSERYPQRNRRELSLALKAFLRKEGREQGAFFILSPSTLAAVRDAVTLRRPILDRYVAVGGSAVKRPQVLRVRIGTRIRELFEECGGLVKGPRRIATGSPLQGRLVADLDEPVTKTCGAVFAFLNSKNPPGKASRCIACGECRAVCPVGLDPEELYKRYLLRRENPALAAAARAEECHGCGCCELVCPSGLPLSATIVASGRRN